MFCHNCGMRFDDDVSFCHNCGTMLREQKAVVPDTQPALQPVSTPVTYSFAEYEPSVEEKTKTYVKKSLSSALFLIATILFTLSTIFGVIAFNSDSEYDIADEPGLFDKLSVAYDAYDIEEDLFDAIDIFDTSIIWAIGLWLTYIFARSKKDMKTGGISTLKVAAMIDIILGFVIAAILVIAGIVGSFEESSPDIIAIMLIIAVPLFAALGFVYVLLTFKVRSDINALHSIFTTGIPTTKISRLVGIFCFIIAAFVIIPDTSGIIDVLSCLTSGASMILFGIHFFRFKSQMKIFAEEYKLANTPAPAGQIKNNNVMI